MKMKRKEMKEGMNEVKERKEMNEGGNENSYEGIKASYDL